MKLLLTFHKQFKVKNSKYWLNLSNKLQQNKNKYRKKNEISINGLYERKIYKYGVF